MRRFKSNDKQYDKMNAIARANALVDKGDDAEFDEVREALKEIINLMQNFEHTSAATLRDRNNK